MALTRRAALAAGLAFPFVSRVRAAEEPLRIGALCPLTGAGGQYGPSMVKVIQATVRQINDGGGIDGRAIALTVADTQTNPDATVAGAHKLIDVDRVAAIAGTWASADTTAAAPLCWEAQVMLFTVSGADSITKLPHKGYIIRTQPNTELQMTRVGQFLLDQNIKRVFALSAQTPFAVDAYNTMAGALKQGGAEAIGQIVYDPHQTSFRSEIDRAMASKPDALFLGAYAPDLTVLLREIYQAGYDGHRMTYGYAATPKVISSLPPAVTDGLWFFSPSPDLGSPAYAAVQKILGTTDPDPYSCQVYDHVNLIALAVGKAGAATGPAIHDNVRRISADGGLLVYDAHTGLKLMKEGKSINYSGASGPCRFTPIGDITTCKFRFDTVAGGQVKMLSLS
ncbi:MAG TPA: ABC transporter substrate-binding protein [Acetobacteraceae bacterium]|nr:ABC transporter substrate-binding protein [Acetobacteraceae bacterium]